MFAQIAYPEKLLPEQLDEYLAMGWFRMRQTIFTTNFLHFGQRFYSAIWLRVLLNEAIHDKKYIALTKLNKNFRVDIRKADTGLITQPQETLYQYYRQSLSFEVSGSLEELLIGNQPYNRFDTHTVNIYDGSSLIATGFFDLGKTSAAGITCIYHPAYKKYSLGKYLMYQKMDFCKERQLEYFYPGYIVPGYQPFDYKLDIGKASLEYLQVSSNNWVAFSPQKITPDPLQLMLEKLAVLQTCLDAMGNHSPVLFYKFFEANLDPYYHGSELFDFPVFLHYLPIAADPYYNLVVYDVRDGNYHLLKCISIINIGFQQDTHYIFDADLLKTKIELFATPGAEEMSARLLLL